MYRGKTTQPLINKLNQFDKFFIETSLRKPFNDHPSYNIVKHNIRGSVSLKNFSFSHNFSDLRDYPSDSSNCYFCRVIQEFSEAITGLPFYSIFQLQLISKELLKEAYTQLTTELPAEFTPYLTIVYEEYFN